MTNEFLFLGKGLVQIVMGIKQLLMVGVDRETPISLREKVCFDKRIGEALTKLKETDGVLETVILSTCHRSEIYVLTSGSEAGPFMRFFSEFFALDSSILRPYLFSLEGIDAVEHLFRVACGLESMVVGEDQILSQVREAWGSAQEYGATGKFTNKLFREAVTLGKKTRAETGITNYSLSISYIAVLFIQEVFKNLHDKTAYVIGTGEMGRLVIKHLIAKGIGRIFVSNRTFETALELKAEIPEITVVPYEQKYEYISTSHVVVSATNAPHYTVNYDKFRAHHAGDKICMVDIALPRDIDPQIGEIEGVTLYTVDDLKKTAESNQKKREHLVLAMEDMVKQSLEDFMRWNNVLYTEPIIRDMNKYADEVCLMEYERIKNKLSDMDEAEKAKIRYSLERVAAKIVNRYLIGLKTLAEEDRLDKSVVEVFGGGDCYEESCESRKPQKPAGIGSN